MSMQWSSGKTDSGFFTIILQRELKVKNDDKLIQLIEQINSRIKLKDDMGLIE